METQIKLQRLEKLSHKLDWYALSQNQELPLEFVMKYPDKPWSWDHLSQHDNLNIDIHVM